MSRTIISSLCAENNLEGTLLTKEEVEEISNRISQRVSKKISKQLKDAISSIATKKELA